MFSVTRDFTFCAAHQVEGHPKCGRPHGHNYVVSVSVAGKALDNHGMVVDFGVLDIAVKPLVDEMDHRYLVSQANIDAENPYAALALSIEGHAFVLGKDHSTAECIAELVHERVVRLFSLNGSDVAVSVLETPRNTAMYMGE